MKRILMSTALVLTTAGFATAQDSSQLRTQVGNYLTTTQYNVDVSTLTDAQVAALYGAMTSSEMASEREAAVLGVLESENVIMSKDVEIENGVVVMVDGVPTPRNQIYAAVANGLVGTEFSGRADNLSDEELVIAYTIISSSETEPEKRNRLVGIFN